jgi:hypothetical protein
MYLQPTSRRDSSLLTPLPDIETRDYRVLRTLRTYQDNLSLAIDLFKLNLDKLHSRPIPSGI